MAARVSANSEVFRYTYDTFGRRTAKLVYPAQGGNALGVTLFIHDGWNLVAEYKLNQGNWEISRSYTWGIDIDGQLQGAGGVGGLLAVTKHQAQSTSHFYPIYDGNGNIEAYLDSNGVPAAIYQYDAFGNILQGAGVGAGPAQMEFSHTFSTKFTDFETGLLYYGSRYYHPELGKWLNRDTIGEDGGANLYGFLGNTATNFFDYLGFSPKPVNPLWGPSGGKVGPAFKPNPNAPNGAVNPIDIIRMLTGILGSTLTGDYFDDPAPPMEYTPGGCEYLITVNGIFNDTVQAQAILDLANKLPFYKNIDGSSYASNGTHFDIDPRKKVDEDSRRKSLGDFAQILLNETVKAIDISALRLADRINAALRKMKEECECYCLHILAHSQGAMTTDMALALVPESEKGKIDVVTVGPEKPIPDYDALRDTYNLVHVDDPVPNSWGAPPFANDGRGINPVRLTWSRPGKVKTFGVRGTFTGKKKYDAHAFKLYADELAKNLRRTPEIGPGAKL